MKGAPLKRSGSADSLHASGSVPARVRPVARAGDTRKGVAASGALSTSGIVAFGALLIASVSARANVHRRRAAVRQAVAHEAPSELSEFIASGPVARVLGLDALDAEKESATWARLAQRLLHQLDLSPAALTPQQRARVYQYYLPTYLWVLRQLEAHRASHSGPGEPPALVLGISAPQGCGKTTLVSSLQRLFNEEGRACASVSLDDFYLTGEAQDALAAANPDNELLRYRGNAGTHDLELAEHTLSALRSLQQPGATAAVPFYDKSLRAGRGDRAPAQDWPTVAAPVQLVLFEGWSLGFSPLADDQAAAAVNPNLAAVNSKLRAYAGAMERFCDAWVMIRVANPGWCFQWRLQAELQMRAAGKPGLTDAQVSDFVQRFMPAYEAYLPALYATGPSGLPGRPLLALDIDAARQLTGAV